MPSKPAGGRTQTLRDRPSLRHFPGRGAASERAVTSRSSSLIISSGSSIRSTAHRSNARNNSSTCISGSTRTRAGPRPAGTGGSARAMRASPGASAPHPPSAHLHVAGRGSNSPVPSGYGAPGREEGRFNGAGIELAEAGISASKYRRAVLGRPRENCAAKEGPAQGPADKCRCAPTRPLRLRLDLAATRVSAAREVDHETRRASRLDADYATRHRQPWRRYVWPPAPSGQERGS